MLLVQFTRMFTPLLLIKKILVLQKVLYELKPYTKDKCIKIIKIHLGLGNYQLNLI